MTEDKLIVREQEQITTTETEAAAALVRSQVEAKYLVALRQKRNIDDVRTALLKDCTRPTFARVARYSIPIAGKSVDGFSIRFAEAAIRLLGNIDVQTTTILDNEEKRIVHVAIIDLEANSSYGKDITIDKTVERRKLSKGQRAIGARKNSYGDTVYLVAATERDMMQKEAAQVSRLIRTNGLRLVPGWLLDECEEALCATLKDAAAQNPDAEKHRIVEAFAGLAIKAASLEQYLGHGLDGITDTELAELQAVYTTIRDGQTSWSKCLEVKTGEAPEDPKDDPNAELRAKIQERARRSKRNRKSQPQAEQVDPETGEVT